MDRLGKIEGNIRLLFSSGVATVLTQTHISKNRIHHKQPGKTSPSGQDVAVSFNWF